MVIAIAISVDVPTKFARDTPKEAQLADLSPDAKLYYGLAENLVAGRGYVDTIRNEQILPPIGHPALRATWAYVIVSPFGIFLTIS